MSGARGQEQVERAYSRTDLLERRRKVMEGWSDYLLEGDGCG